MPDETAAHQERCAASMHKALLLVEEAIDILDLGGAPEDIAAHLEMGRHRLEVCLHLEE
jgi:hypothetical protein